MKQQMKDLAVRRYSIVRRMTRSTWRNTNAAIQGTSGSIEHSLGRLMDCVRMLECHMEVASRE